MRILTSKTINYYTALVTWWVKYHQKSYTIIESWKFKYSYMMVFKITGKLA